MKYIGYKILDRSLSWYGAALFWVFYLRTWDLWLAIFRGKTQFTFGQFGSLSIYTFLSALILTFYFSINVNYPLSLLLNMPLGLLYLSNWANFDVPFMFYFKWYIVLISLVPICSHVKLEPSKFIFLVLDFCLKLAMLIENELIGKLIFYKAPPLLLAVFTCNLACGASSIQVHMACLVWSTGHVKARMVALQYISLDAASYCR